MRAPNLFLILALSFAACDKSEPKKIPFPDNTGSETKSPAQPEPSRSSRNRPRSSQACAKVSAVTSLAAQASRRRLQAYTAGA